MVCGHKTSTSIQMVLNCGGGGRRGSPLSIPIEEEDFLLNPNSDRNSHFASQLDDTLSWKANLLGPSETGSTSKPD